MIEGSAIKQSINGRGLQEAVWNRYPSETISNCWSGPATA
jgi:hypothetical protein